MILAALLPSLGVGALDRADYDHVCFREAATDLLWLVVFHVEPGGPVTGSIIRNDPGTMGRALFHFRTTPRDGRHSLGYISLDSAVVRTALPPLPAVCAFMRAARRAVAARQVPDLEALAWRDHPPARGPR